LPAFVVVSVTIERIMKTREFSLTLAAEPTEEQADDIYGVIDDATLVAHSGRAELQFHREAHSLEEAMRSAISDVKKAGLNATLVQMETQALLQQA